MTDEQAAQIVQGIAALDAMIRSFQATPKNMTAEEQAVLDGIASASAALKVRAMATLA